MRYKLVRYPLGENADLGFMMKKDNDIVIFTNSCSRLSREIFTLAHEVGHVILHLNDENTFIDDRITINGRSTDEKEQEANYFAACLLMPSDDVHRFIDLEIQNFQECGLSAMDIARIMSEFNVSFDMALNRLESLGVINTDQKMRLDNIKTEMKVGNLLHAVGGNSKLNEPSEVIDIPHEYIDYVIYNYNHNAVPKETLERVLAYYKQVVSKTLAQNEHLSVTLFAFDKSEEISTHESGGDAFVTCLDGVGKITIDGVDYELHEGESIVMPAKHPHAVFGKEQFKMLLVVVF